MVFTSLIKILHATCRARPILLHLLNGTYYDADYAIFWIFLLRRSKSPITQFLKHVQSMLFPYWDWPSFTPIQNKMISFIFLQLQVFRQDSVRIAQIYLPLNNSETMVLILLPNRYSIKHWFIANIHNDTVPTIYAIRRECDYGSPVNEDMDEGKTTENAGRDCR
jgi:hypothetical protein